VPADLRLGPSIRDVMVRFNADPWDPGVIGGRDFVRFNLGTFSETARIGASGGVFAVDSLSYGRNYASSVGEDFPLGQGYVHVVNAQ
ncbi:MAG TPA: hypothetical protein PKI99_06760, partial [Terrimesophilobacter sp.]|nr:hypothetical protein [Terrimesophilobacter sp.]